MAKRIPQKELIERRAPTKIVSRRIYYFDSPLKCRDHFSVVLYRIMSLKRLSHPMTDSQAQDFQEIVYQMEKKYVLLPRAELDKGEVELYKKQMKNDPSNL